MGYLDNSFFGYTVNNEDTGRWLMEAREAIDYYLDRLFFTNSTLEYDTFISKPLYRGYVNSLKYKYDQKRTETM